MHEYVENETNNGHNAAQAIKDLQAPTYDMQPYPSTMKPDPGEATINILIK